MVLAAQVQSDQVRLVEELAAKVCLCWQELKEQAPVSQSADVACSAQRRMQCQQELGEEVLWSYCRMIAFRVVMSTWSRKCMVRLTVSRFTGSRVAVVASLSNVV